MITENKDVTNDYIKEYIRQTDPLISCSAWLPGGESEPKCDECRACLLEKIDNLMYKIETMELESIDRTCDENKRVTADIQDLTESFKENDIEMAKFIITIANLWDSDRLKFEWDEFDTPIENISAWITKAETVARIVTERHKLNNPDENSG